MSADDINGVVVTILIVAGLLAIAVYQWKAAQKRREDMFALAAQGGWTFSPAKDTGIGRLCDSEIFTRGENRCAYNTITGDVQYGPYRCSIDMGDFRYTIKRRTSKGHQTSTTYKFSYLMVRLPFRDNPRVRIRREGLLDSITQALGFEDIDFESEEFSRKYCVTSEDKKFAYALLHARAMEYFLAIEPPELIELASGRIMVTDGLRRWPVESFRKRMTWAKHFISLWPEHLARDLQPRRT